MTGTEKLENWRLAVDDRDEITIIGTIDGKPDGGLLAETKNRNRGLVRLRDGRLLSLGTPHPAVADDPWTFPDGYHERRLARLKQVLERLRTGEGPTAEECAAAPLLEAWCLQQISDKYVVLCGYVSGHPRLPDDAWIYTSPVIWLDETQGAARTVSRWYRLGASLHQAIQT